MAIYKDGVKYLEGDGTWPFLSPFIDGNDIVVRGIIGSFFDDQSTASGVSAATPEILGCALPLNVPHSQFSGSPIPEVPFGTQVRVYSHFTGVVVLLTSGVIDVGPAKSLERGIDLTPAAFQALGLTEAEGLATLDYRIFGAAQYVQG